MSFDMTEEFRDAVLNRLGELVNSIQGEINTAGSAFKDKFGNDPNVDGYIQLYMVQPLSNTKGCAPTSNLFHNIVESSKDWATSNASIHNVSEMLHCGEGVYNMSLEFERDIIEKFEKLDNDFNGVIEKYKNKQINRPVTARIHMECNEIINPMVNRISALLQAVKEDIQNGENGNTAAQKIVELINDFICPCVATFFKQAFDITVEEKETRAKLESMFIDEGDAISSGIDSLNSHAATLIN